MGAVEVSLTFATRVMNQLGLKPWLVETCDKLGIRQPTPVQQNCIPQILKGLDVMGGAATGSGKTATFALPILNVLSDDPYGIFALILTPTRELAVQISEQFKAFGGALNLRLSVVVGGLDMLRQAQELQRKPHIVIATPGRLVDHLRSNSAVCLTRLKFLVLDEADRLLDMGFAEELKTILEHVPVKRQTLLFSATMTKNLEKLQRMALKEPFVYDGCPKYNTVDSLVQQYLFVPLAVKECYLHHLLKETFPEKIIIVFVNTCQKCQLLFHLLHEVGIPSAALHSQQTMNRRLAALAKFRAGQVKILLATDVAGRGLDIPEVDVVINYDMCAVGTDYIHRVGRTARAGRRGVSVSIVSQYDIELFLEIEKRIGKKIPELELEEEEVLKLLNQTAAAKKIAKLMMADLEFDKQKRPKAKKRALPEDDDGGDGNK
eukprot:c9320_g1_i1.p2 GENE.c9320_g1_i1~~c9320_g1_i1.p2  ORF type:complete len:434 (-),score=114.20 c9320_g1_i1:1566-2867(-)